MALSVLGYKYLLKESQCKYANKKHIYQCGSS